MLKIVRVKKGTFYDFLYEKKDFFLKRCHFFKNQGFKKRLRISSDIFI